MLTTRFVLVLFLLGMVLSASVAFGQNYPNRPIRIVTVSIGGSNDFEARLIAQGISGPLGQPVITDNRQTAIVPELVKNAPPDGYTLLLNGSGFMFRPLLQKVNYDPVKDFSPITLTVKSPLVLVVHPSVPAKSVKELIALAKAKPGGLSHATLNPGGGLHLAMELFKSMAGVNIEPIFYKSNGAALNGLLAGEVQIIFGDIIAVAPHVKAGKVRPLAVSSLEPTVLFPGLPTVAASGLPGYELVGIDGIWAPAGTPARVINRLNEEIVRVLNNPEVKEKFFNTGVETVGSSPEQLAAAMKQEIAKTAKVLKDAGIKPE